MQSGLRWKQIHCFFAVSLIIHQSQCLEKSEFCCFLCLVVEYDRIEFPRTLRGLFFGTVVVRGFCQVVKSFFVRFLFWRKLSLLFFHAISLSAAHPQIKISQKAEKQHSGHQEKYYERQWCLVEEHSGLENCQSDDKINNVQRLTI